MNSIKVFQNIYSNMKNKILNYVFINLLRARWIVGEENELGLRIMGVNLIYYKWPEPMMSESKEWRFAEKREFGETIRSVRTPSVY